MVWDRWIAESVSFNFKTKLSTIVRDLPLNFTSNGGFSNVYFETIPVSLFQGLRSRNQFKENRIIKWLSVYFILRRKPRENVLNSLLQDC